MTTDENRTPARPPAAPAEGAGVCGRCGQPEYVVGKVHHPINFVRCHNCYDHEFVKERTQ